MINELRTGEFAFYEQKIREAKDDYTKNKVLKDKRKAQRWLTLLLEDREVILTYKNGEEIITTIATLKVDSDQSLPSTPLTHVEKNGEIRLEDHYVRFYKMPQILPDSVHIDQVLCFFVRSDNINEVSAKMTPVGKKYVKESIQEEE